MSSVWVSYDFVSLDPFLDVFANCGKLPVALGAVAVSSCCACGLVTGNVGKRPGIVLTKQDGNEYRLAGFCHLKPTPINIKYVYKKPIIRHRFNFVSKLMPIMSHVFNGLSMPITTYHKMVIQSSEQIYFIAHQNT
jgi:hypothetical protein